MNKTAKVILSLVAIAVLGVGGYAVFHKNNVSTVSSNIQPTNAAGTTSSTPNTSSIATITFTDNGFSPALITVKSGDTIRITNRSSQPIQLDSDPHPAHTDDTELNVGTVDAGSSETFVLTTKGNWGYHDHLSPGFTGRINVE
ncbi:MAG TPA: hypothetical protein VFI84_04270 [Candidatus Saccharimonadales bacterium]|nr:hypothetical protein [Candidatus Saccharimonadales bacterium]